MASIFVTGGTGKVGRHVVGGLLERNEEVRVLARDPRPSGCPTRLRWWAGI